MEEVMKGRNSVIILAIFAVVVISAMFFGNNEENDQLARIESQVSSTLEQMNERDVSGMVEVIRNSAEKAGVIMAQLNLSEEAVQKILHQGYVSEAKKWVSIAYERKSNEDIEYAIEYAKKFASMASMTLVDFGLTETVLKDILREGNISSARKWLVIAEEQKVNEDVTYAINYAKQYAEKAGVTIHEI